MTNPFNMTQSQQQARRIGIANLNNNQLLRVKTKDCGTVFNVKKTSYFKKMSQDKD